MVERRSGAVINIASAAGHFGTSPEVAYSTIKAAIVHFTRCLAYEMREAPRPGELRQPRPHRHRAVPEHARDSIRRCSRRTERSTRYAVPATRPMRWRSSARRPRQ